MADRKVEIVITQVNGGGSDKVKSALRSVGDEVARINKETQEQAKKTDRIIQEATKARVNAEIAEEKRLERTRKQAASNFISEIKRLDQETKSLSRTGSIFAGSFLGFSAAGAAAGAVTSITSAAKQGIGVWLDYASKVEQAKIGFTTMIGSADEAGKHLKALQNFAKSTPFDFEELVTASQKMQGVGIAASKVIPLLKDVGNALAASGRLGDLPEAVKALGDIQAKGKLAGQEIIQLANAGIPAIKMLSEYLGKSSADILKLSEDGQISADILFAALHKMSSERFGDAMEKQSKTFMGAMSNITDALKQTAQTAFQPLYDRISGLAVKFSQEISQQQGDLEKVGGVIAKYIGQGLSEGLIAATEGIGKAIGGRLAGIFTKAEFIDPISKGFAEGVAKGIVEGFGRVNVRNMILEWVFKAMTGADVHLGRTSGSGEGSTTGYTRTFPGTSGFNLNLGGGSGPFRTNTFGEPSNATAYTRLFHGGAGNATISVLPMPGDTSKSGGKGGKSGKSGGMKDVLPAFGSMRELAISSGNPQWDAWFVEMGRKFDVDPNILLLQAGKESSYNKNAVSPKGAKGFSQFMPGTAKRFDVDTSSVKDSIRGQAEYMGLLLSMFGGDYSKALAGYNAGEGAVQKFGGVPPYKETRDYVARIKGGYASRVRKGASYGTYEIPEEGGLSTSGGISDELGNLKKPNEELLRVYKDMAETLFNLEEHTQKEVFLMDVKLGKYPEQNDATVAEIANTYELIDATKKATDEKKAAADKQADYEKRVQSEVENLKREEYQKTRDVINESLDYLSRGDFKGFGRAILERQRQAVVEKTTDWILDKLGIQNPDDTPELREAKKQTKLLQAIAGQAGGPLSAGPLGLGGLFGGNQGGGIFNYGGGGGSGGGSASGSGGGGGFNSVVSIPGVGPVPIIKGGGKGGFFGGLGSIFGSRKNVLTGGMSKMGGMMGGIGDIASMAGGMIGGKWGNLISMAGQGASIGSMFGPWGAAIGAAAGGLIGLFTGGLFGGDNSIKKIKEAALSTYGITVKDKSVLKTIKQLGEQYFGKGKAGANATQLMQVDEVKEILKNYAEASGQSSMKIDRLSYGDENWKGNQFRSSFGGFKAMGGPVGMGRSYIVGERGPEMFTPGQSGSITPNHQLGGQQLNVILGSLADVIESLDAKITSMRPGDVVAAGAKQNPKAIREAQEYELQTDLRAGTNQFRLNGQYT